MGELDKELQVYAVQLVLDEIEMYERTLDSVDASWWETYLNCTLPQEFFDNPEGVNEKLDSEATKIDKATSTTESCGIPLKRIVLGGEYVCDIGTIKWNNIRSKKAERRVVFSNDGTISFAKMALCYSNKIRGDYDGSYNVLSDNFKITFTEYERLQRGDKVIFEPKCTKMELHNATLVVSRGDFNLVHNLETGL